MTTRFISSGQTSSGLTVKSGNNLKILSGGATESNMLPSGGSEYVFRGGVASGTVVSGAGEIV